MTGRSRPRLVLVGAGHAHAVALRRWYRDGGPAADLVVVTDRLESLYSGMVPGWLAGEYRRSELVMDARVMTERVGGRLVLGRVERIDVDRGRVELADGGWLPFDLASIDAGSVVSTPGDGASGSPVSARRPDEILDRLSELELRRKPDPAPTPGGGERGRKHHGDERHVVVGGGAGGVELAACLRGRGIGDVTLLEAGSRLMPGRDPAVSERAARALERRGVTVRCGSGVRKVESGALHLDDGETVAAELVVWATGPAPPPLLAASGLPTDEAGFLRVGEDLRVVGHDHLFAAGDCASLEGHDVPKAGVHAVRQGSILLENLSAVAARMVDDAGAIPKQSLARYEPQSDFLTLLNLGDGTALGTKWGWVVEGRWVRWIKDVIDRRFVEELQEP